MLFSLCEIQFTKLPFNLKSNYFSIELTDKETHVSCFTFITKRTIPHLRDNLFNIPAHLERYKKKESRKKKLFNKISLRVRFIL